MRTVQEAEYCGGSMFQAGSKDVMMWSVRPLVKCKTAGNRYPMKATEKVLEALSYMMRKPGMSHLYSNV